jgi:hypothetical protein
MDYDPIGSNDVLGYVHLSVAEVISWLMESSEGRLKRHFPLVSGRGISESKVSGTLTVSLSYQKYTARQGGARVYAQHVFSFYPPLVMENQLPHEIQIKITKLDPLSGAELRHDIFRIPKGGQMPFYEIDGVNLDYLNEAKLAASRLKSTVADKTVQAGSNLAWNLASNLTGTAGKDLRANAIIQVRYSGHEQSKWSDPITAPNTCIPLFDQVQEFVLGSVSLEVVHNPSQDGGSRRCVVYAPFWIVNKSDLALDFLPVQSKLPGKLKVASKGIGAIEYPHDWIERREPGSNIVCLSMDTELGVALVRGRSTKMPTRFPFGMPANDALFKTDQYLTSGIPRSVSLSSRAGET